MFAAICDDDKFFRHELRNHLINYRRARRLNIDIFEFENGMDLLNSEYVFDIVFLDYDMPTINGIETARKLRDKNNLCCIIYISSYPEHVFESFEVRTYRYLLKPTDENILTNTLDNYIREKRMFTPIIVNIDGEQLAINSEDIICVEADGKYCNIITKHDVIHCSKTLAKVFELLPSHCFFRTHKSYAVNLYYVESAKDGIVRLKYGQWAKLSRNKISEFKNAYKDFAKHFVVRM